jgi:hypothetical protein
VITEEIKAAFDPADEGLVRELVEICARIGDRHTEKFMQMPVAAELLLVKLPVIFSVHETRSDPTRTSCDVRFRAAIREMADVERI